MNSKKVLIFLFLFILFSWFSFSVFRTFFNLLKIPNDIKLLAYSSDEKKNATYGIFFDFCKFVQEKTPENSKILFLSSSGKAFYVCRYELYPRQLYYITKPSQIPDKLDYDFLIYYSNFSPGLNENNSEEWDLRQYKLEHDFSDESYGKGGIVSL